MLLEQVNWILGYNQIRRDCSPDGGESIGGTVLMLCNPDADALCAARILSYAFRADGIPYQLRPCGGYARMLQILQRVSPENKSNSNPPSQDATDESSDWEDEDLFSNCSLRAVILLNIGAIRNLDRLFFSPTPILDATHKETGQDRPPLLNKKYTKVYVIDSRRPFHLANVHAGFHVVLWNDYNWCLNSSIGDIPSDGDDLSGADEDESSDEDSDEENDSKSSDDSDEAEFQEEEGGDKDDETESAFDESTHADNSTVTKKRSKQFTKVVKSKRIRADDRSSDSDEESGYESPSKSKGVDVDDNLSESSSKQDRKLVNKDEDGAKSSVPALSLRELHRRRLDKIRIYYKEGTFFSAPIAFNVYNLLCKEMRFESVGDLLWLACVGVTDAYIHSRIDLCGYAQFATELKGHVDRVYPDYSGTDGLLRRSANTIFSESLYGRTGTVDGPKTQIGLSENGRIVTQNDELRFFLLRHTSLWEAMRLSPHVCTKMELYKALGMKKLQEMLAKMGIPLAQCQQQYAFMNPNLKRRLKQSIREHAEDFSLDNISYTGFLRVTGYKSFISASDMCYAVTALLECEPFSKDKKSNMDTRSPEDDESRLMYSFNIAYDALNANGGASSMSGECGGISSGFTEGSDLSSLVNGSDMSSSNGLGAGLKMALALQRTIISTAIGLVERKAIHRLTHFRYAYLNCTSQGPTGGLGHGLTFGSIKSSRKGSNPDSDIFHIFTKPLALTKLANFLMDMHRANGKWAGVRASPLILMAESPQTQTYVVVGYESQEHSDKNRFGQNFVLAAKTMRGTFKFDSFDSNVVEVKATEVQKFIEQLHYVMEETK